jgi:hypothetical protein
MDLRSAFCGLILPAVLVAVAADPAFAAPGKSKTYNYTGTVANFCKIGTSTSYSISILVTGSGAMTSTISLDGTAGNPQNQNNQTTTITKNYTTLCNLNSQQTLTLTAPAATKTGGAADAYTFTVKNAANGAGTTVATVGSEPGSATVVIPAMTSGTWSIIATATNRNSQAAGTYTATVTIQ